MQAHKHPSKSSRAARRRLLLTTLVLASVVLAGLWSKPTFSLADLDINGRLSYVYHAVTAYRGPVRVGLQVGHLNVQDHPEELANLRYNTGAHAGGLNEVDINYAVAQQLKASLELDGITVDVLPATVPENYKADLLLSLHADASPDEWRRGYKSSHFRAPRNKLEPDLKTYIDEAYLYYSGLPDDDMNVSGSMLDYYAFNRRKFRHSVATSTPALLVEMGYLSSSEDRSFLQDPTNPAYALKQGIVAYLESRNRLPRTASE